MANNPFDILKGRRVSAVVFVHDYVQFQFEGPDLVLTTYSLPSISADGRRIDPNGAGWRDCLCALIDRRVDSVVVESTEVTVQFDDSHQLSVSRDAGASGDAESGELISGLGRPIVVF